MNAFTPSQCSLEAGAASLIVPHSRMICCQAHCEGMKRSSLPTLDLATVAWYHSQHHLFSLPGCPPMLRRAYFAGDPSRPGLALSSKSMPLPHKGSCICAMASSIWVPHSWPAGSHILCTRPPEKVTRLSVPQSLWRCCRCLEAVLHYGKKMWMAHGLTDCLDKAQSDLLELFQHYSVHVAMLHSMQRCIIKFSLSHWIKPRGAICVGHCTRGISNFAILVPWKQQLSLRGS